jgi:hypothetical protein
MKMEKKSQETKELEGKKQSKIKRKVWKFC